MRALEEADPEIRPGPAEMERGEVALVELARPIPQTCHVRLPGRYRILEVEAAHDGDLLPEPLDVGLAEEVPCPTLGRAGDHGPRHREAEGLVVHDLAVPARPRLRGSRLLDVREEP